MNNNQTYNIVDINTLINLQEQVAKEAIETNRQSDTFGYVIVEKKEILNHNYDTNIAIWYTYNGETVVNFGTDTDKYATKNECLKFIEFAIRQGLVLSDEGNEALLTHIEKTDTFDELWEYLINHNKNFDAYIETIKPYNVSDNFFLTKKDAEDFIRQNHGLFNNDVQAIPVTTNKNVSLEAMLQFIQTFDFRSLHAETLKSPSIILNGVATFATHFAFDGTHRFYILEDKQDTQEALNIGFDIKAIHKLDGTFEAADEPRFITNWKKTFDFIDDDTHPTFD